MAMIAPTTSSLRSSVRESQKFGKTVSGEREAGGAAFPFLGPAFDADLARDGDFPFGFARDFDFLDELEKGVFSGMVFFEYSTNGLFFFLRYNWKKSQPQFHGHRR